MAAGRMMTGSPCIICHNRGDQTKLMKLQKLKQLCDSKEIQEQDISKSPIRKFQWGINSRCRYSLPCMDLNTFDNRCKRLAGDIEDKLIMIAMTNDDRYFQILEILRGDFPAVYTAMERIRHSR